MSPFSCHYYTLPFYIFFIVRKKNSRKSSKKHEAFKKKKKKYPSWYIIKIAFSRITIDVNRKSTYSKRVHNTFFKKIVKKIIKKKPKKIKISHSIQIYIKKKPEKIEKIHGKFSLYRFKFLRREIKIKKKGLFNICIKENVGSKKSIKY